MLNEGFTVQGNEVTGMFDKSASTTTNPVTLESVLKSEFKEGTKRNPFSNVLLTEIMDDPERNAAPRIELVGPEAKVSTGNRSA